MELSPDLIDLLRALSDAGVRFLVVGAHAVVYHSEPRYTKDLDLWVELAPDNVGRLWQALVRFGAPLAHSRPEQFADPMIIFQMGVEPNRVDVMMGIDGLEFSTAWKHRVRTTYGGVAVNVLGRSDLIQAKLASGRPQDLLDVARLQQRPKGRAPRRSSPKRRRPQ